MYYVAKFWKKAKICKICWREGDFLGGLEKCWKMRVWTRKSALIQRRTSLGKSDCVLRLCSWLHRSSSCSRSRAFAARSLAFARSFARLVLGWIEADFCNQGLIFAAFFEIYKINIPLHRSNLKSSGKIVQLFGVNESWISFYSFQSCDFSSQFGNVSVKSWWNFVGVSRTF